MSRKINVFLFCCLLVLISLLLLFGIQLNLTDMSLYVALSIKISNTLIMCCIRFTTPVNLLPSSTPKSEQTYFKDLDLRVISKLINN